MTDDKELKHALELAHEGVEIHLPNSPEYKVCAALIALAQTEYNPVGFYDAENKDLRREIPMGEDGDWWQPVYTHPPVHTAQPKEPKHEPVAYQDKAKPTELIAAEDWDNIDPQWHWMYQPLYTAQPQRKTLTPVEGDLLPAIGSKVLIHLARQDEWVEHTVVGYYVWGDLDGVNARRHRVFVRVADADGILNARMLCDIRPIESAHGIKGDE